MNFHLAGWGAFFVNWWIVEIVTLMSVPAQSWYQCLDTCHVVGATDCPPHRCWLLRDFIGRAVDWRRGWHRCTRPGMHMQRRWTSDWCNAWFIPRTFSGRKGHSHAIVSKDVSSLHLAQAELCMQSYSILKPLLLNTAFSLCELMVTPASCSVGALCFSKVSCSLCLSVCIVPYTLHGVPWTSKNVKWSLRFRSCLILLNTPTCLVAIAQPCD
jgi:hypothetical protein